MRNLKLYNVLSNPDLNEGRGYYQHQYYLTLSEVNLKKYLLDSGEYNEGIGYVMGNFNCPMKNYCYRLEDNILDLKLIRGIESKLKNDAKFKSNKLYFIDDDLNSIKIELKDLLKFVKNFIETT